ncbi:hypothetical protein FKX85_13475 [Echinicola soli]|uniref:Integral membrane protein n=1 Tax=Echinicola soli TaxID=2591634 RepID=A0A514CJI6_9BACT|nr:hypothetical protein [Echinicola soli]QDH79987.1 hypothetical protein FKX85_13475 [Echinicola soli]
MENLNIVIYLVYLPVTVLMTIVTAKVLFKNSKIFMLEIFLGREKIAFSTNRLFEIGFYLLNIGVALMTLRTGSIENSQSMVETLSRKVGVFSIYLGLMLFLNLWFFFRGKKKAKQNPLPTT